MRKLKKEEFQFLGNSWVYKVDSYLISLEPVDTTFIVSIRGMIPIGQQEPKSPEEWDRALSLASHFLDAYQTARDAWLNEQG